ncbi:M48 family metalloprotease [Streptomyces sp. NPDC057654]|uniref:M48 family metalloprotease n=1 Tax=Streptomyces sp. NPDC057654 TaxID=3346196 RepID=UPI00368F127C
MRMGDAVARYWAWAMVGAVVTAEVLVGPDRPQPVAAVYLALVVGGVWCWERHDRASRAVDVGLMAQHMTWDGYVRPLAVSPDEPDHIVALAARMRQTEEYVQAFAAGHGLERVSIAVAGHRLGQVRDASSLRHGNRAHLWLGHRWFTPDATAHLPVLLEHELAHVRRRDNRKRLIGETSAVTVTVGAAGMLPLPSLAFVAGGIVVLLSMSLWWDELACDTAAVRACGRPAAAALWAVELDEARTQPLLRRAGEALLALRTHPPLRLRRRWARLVPLGHAATRSGLCHPLAGMAASTASPAVGE